MKNTFRTLAALMCVLAVLFLGSALAETVEPTSTPIPTPSAEDLGRLVFEIRDAEGALVTQVPYSEFTDGKYSVEALKPGTYTVTEVDPDKLLENLSYTFDTENSVPSMTFEVKANETATETLLNIYSRGTTVTPVPGTTETPTPEASETPEPTPTPTPEPDDKISIPVVKIWDDMGNRDGNRPDRVLVKLLADGNKVAETVLNNANGWSYQFTDLPKYSGTREIVYTVTEDPVPLYTSSVDGYVITNSYTPQTTSVTVSKVWLDNDNSAGLRPVSIYCTLSNGMHVTLSAANNWTATINDLPVKVNGETVDYTWTEQEVIGYTLSSEDTAGSTTVFTNSLIERRKDVPPEKSNVPKKSRGNKYLVIEDYGTPLGVEVVINHVGDCFD
jgi:hypothetical protein